MNKIQEVNNIKTTIDQLLEQYDDAQQKRDHELVINISMLITEQLDRLDANEIKISSKKVHQ